jgi:hypothetical protein
MYNYITYATNYGNRWQNIFLPKDHLAYIFLPKDHIACVSFFSFFKENIRSLLNWY